MIGIGMINDDNNGDNNDDDDDDDDDDEDGVDTDKRWFPGLSGRSSGAGDNFPS